MEKEIEGKIVEVESFSNVLVRTLYAIISLLMWTRFALYLKIYSGIGSFIRLIEETLKEMKYMVIVLFISIIGFF